MGIIFGKYNNSTSPRMTWFGEYSYERTSNTVVQVTLTINGEILNHVHSSWIGTGNAITVSAKAGSAATQTWEAKASSGSWYGDGDNPKSHTFTFNVTSDDPGESISVSYSVAATGYSAPAAVPQQTVSFSSPALLYTPSTPSIASGTKRMGTAFTITITRAQSGSNVTHRLYYSFASSSYTKIGGDAIATSYSWTPDPEELARLIPNSTYGTCAIRCDTYSESTKIGSKSISFKLYIPSSYAPSVTASAAIVNSISGITAGIQNVSTVKLTVTGASASTGGATLKSVVFSGEGYSKTVTSSIASATYTTGVIKNTGSRSFTIKVTDSRGLTASTTKSVTINAYSPPSITDARAFRVDQNGNPTPSGTRINYVLTFSYSNISGNSCTGSLAYKRVSDPDSSYTGTISNLSSSTSARSTGWASLLTGTSYIVRFQVSDSITSSPTETLFSISTELRSIHIHKTGKGLGFGKVAETANIVDSVWNIWVTKSGKSIFIGTGSGGDNHGIYSNTALKWIAYADQNGDVHLPGEADKAKAVLHNVANGGADFISGRIPFLPGSTDGSSYSLRSNDGIYFTTRDGTTSQVGSGILSLGNNIAEGTAGNKYGAVRFYSNAGSYATLRCLNGTATRTIELPDKSGTVALTSDIPELPVIPNLAANYANGYFLMGDCKVCFGKMTVAYAATTSSGGHYYGNSTSITNGNFKSVFKSAPSAVILTGASPTTSIYGWECVTATGSGITSVRVHRSTSYTDTSGTDVYYIAIGTRNTT